MKSRKVLILRSLDILTDSRVQRYEKWLKKHQIPYQIVGWDREGKKLQREHTRYCTLQAGYHQRVGGIKNRIKWNIFLMKYLITHMKEYQIIHACDFDTIMPALCMKLLGKKVIFDIFDWFSDEVKTGKKIIDWPINQLEKLATQLADLTIICEAERIEQMRIKPKQYIVVSNIPDEVLEQVNTKSQEKEEQVLTLAYVGGFYPDRGLETLIEVMSKNEGIDLQIAGFGDKKLEQLIQKASETCKNIHYLGKVSYKQASQIMVKADLIYGMYYKNNPNHIYAAPNKFYESIALEKPIITTKGTLVGQKVEQAKTGYVIEEGTAVLQTLLDQIREHGKQKDLIASIRKNKEYIIEKSKENEANYISFIIQ